MAHSVVAHLVGVCARLAAWTSNAWTRVALKPTAVRRVAGLRSWDSDCVS